MANLTTETAGGSTSMPHDFKSKMNSAQARMKSAAHQAEEKLADQASHYIDEGRTLIESHPIRSVAIASVAGLAIGGLLMLAFRTNK